MKRSRDVRCRKNGDHSSLDRKHSKCNDCDARLVVTCSFCKKTVSYSFITKHEEACGRKTAETENEQVARRQRRIAYVSSDWELGEDGFVTMPRGQYPGGLPANFTEAVGADVTLRVHSIDDPSTRGEQWMDTYDAIIGHIACDSENFELVRVFEDWTKLSDLLSTTGAGGAFADIDILIVGNWIHNVVLFDQGDMASVGSWHRRLEMLEVEADLRVFPPLDYAMHFAFKDVYYRHLLRMQFPLGFPLHCIPTSFIAPEQQGWKKVAKELAIEQAVDSVVFKRSVSECNKHVRMVNVSSLPGLKLANRGADGFTWMLQPIVDQFAHNNEIRMYLVGGKVLWAVSSSAREEDGSLFLSAIGKGLRGSDWSEQLVSAVESMVELLSTRAQVHSRHFLRVDLVKKDNGSWYVNELEPFGNTSLHLEVMSDAPLLFPELVNCIKNWMMEL